MTREEAIKEYVIPSLKHTWNEKINKEVLEALEQEPRCKYCRWWKDSDGKYRRGCRAESQCPINTPAVYFGEGYCYMYESQESEEQEDGETD